VNELPRDAPTTAPRGGSAARYVSSPGAAIVLAGLAVAATVFWILWGADSTGRSRDFVSTPQFILWLLILCGLSALLMLAAWPVTRIFWQRASELRSHGGLGLPAWLYLAVGWVVLVGLLAFPLYLRQLPWASSVAEGVPVADEWPLVHHELKLTVVSLASFLLAFLTIGGIWFVGIALARMSSEEEEANQTERFFALREGFTVLLAIASALLGLSMFATAALRSAVIAADPDSRYEIGYILAFGLWFSGLLALACAPSYAALRAAGSSLVDRACPLPETTDAKLVDTLEKRQALERLLGLNLTASAVVKSGAVIASPFIGSLIGLLIPE
jgi:hypothetical protein